MPSRERVQALIAHVEQGRFVLAHQRWDGDRIVEERFYYDPAQRKLA